MEWITTNWVAVVAIVSLVLQVVRKIAQLTPSEKDDAVVAKISTVVSKLLGIK